MTKKSAKDEVTEPVRSRKDLPPREVSEDGKVRTRKKGKKRRPFGVPGTRLPQASDPNYHYRVFNDNWRKDPNRIQRAMDAGYEVVDHEKSNMTVGSNETGDEIRGVLMRIPKELHDEDEAAREGQRAKIDAEIHTGRYKEGRGDHRYLPKGEISMDSKPTP